MPVFRVRLKIEADLNEKDEDIAVKTFLGELKKLLQDEGFAEAIKQNIKENCKIEENLRTVYAVLSERQIPLLIQLKMNSLN